MVAVLDYYKSGYVSSNEEATKNVHGKQDGILNDKFNGQSMRLLSTYTLGTTFYYTFFSAIWKTAISGNPLVLKVSYNPAYTVQYFLK